MGDFSQSCFSVCQSESLSCFDGPNDAVNTPLETLFVSSEELGIDCLAVDAVQESENIPSLPRVRVDIDGQYALCQYTVASVPVSICASIPPASYRRFCCCGTSADECPTLDEESDEESDEEPEDVEDIDEGDMDNGDGFDFLGIFGIIGLILAVLAAIGGAIGAAVGLGFALGEADGD